MSYCRWSSDDFQCDIYCYADVSGGYTTHVAGKRYVFKQPLPPTISIIDSVEEWFERDQKVSEMLKSSALVKIGLPSDGKSFNDATATEAAARLANLKEEGYRVPQSAIDALLEE
jgi:hypothetical protein